MDVPSFSSFQHRATGVELMDDLDLGGNTIRQTLDQLELVNRYLGGTQAWRGVQHLISEAPTQQAPLTIADLGCGGGDGLRRIAKWGRKTDISMRLIGFDANPHVVAYAREKSQDWPEISFEVADITDASFLTRQFDVLTASLVLHHFQDRELQHLIPAYVAMSRRGLVVADLQRHWLPWSLFALVTKIMGASHMIRHDGLLSVRRGFTRRELTQKLQATTYPYQLQWCWAFRYLAWVYKR